MAIHRIASKGFKVRKVQHAFVDSVLDAENYPHKISLVQADTGTGKTLGYLAAALEWVDKGYRVIIATPSHQLMRQIARVELPLINDDIPVGLYFGLTHYPAKQRIENLILTGTFSVQTEDYLKALSSFTSPVSDFIDEFGPLPDEISLSSVTCLRSEDLETVQDERLAELNKPLIVTSHHAVISDYMRRGALFGHDSETILILDEADQFLDLAESMRSMKLSVNEVISALAEHCSVQEISPLIELADQLKFKAQHSDLCKAIETIEIISGFLTEMQGLSNGSKKWQKEFREGHSHWFHRPMGLLLGASKAKRMPQIISSNPFITWRVGEYLQERFDFTVMVGGTLSIKHDISGFSWIHSILNIHDAVGVMAIHTPDVYGSLAIKLAASNPLTPNVYVRNGVLSHAWLSYVANGISECKGNVLVLTSSHTESIQLHEIMNAAGETRPIHRHASGHSIKGAAETFMAEGGVMITAAGHTGLNIVQSTGVLGFNSLFITRIGMSPSDDDRVRYEAKIASIAGNDERTKYNIIKQAEYSKNIVRAVRKLKQSIGRCIRSSEHHGEVNICDPRFPLYQDRESRMSILRNAIPVRFTDEYKLASKRPEMSADTQHKMEVFF